MTTPLPTGWEADILTALGAPVTPNNIGNLDIWQAYEGGSTKNVDSYNPFNTTLPYGGSHGTNSVNVQAFTDWPSGLHATVATIEQHNMAPILAALKGDVSAPQFDAAVNGTPWGSHLSSTTPPGSPGGGNSGGGIGGVLTDPLTNNPADNVAQIPGAITGLAGNVLADFVNALIKNGLVLRGTLMVTGLIILFIGLSQLSKGDQTPGQTVGGGVSTVRVHVGTAANRVAKPAGRATGKTIAKVAA